MATINGYEAAKALALANARTFGVDYCVFCDTSGRWRVERFAYAPTGLVGTIGVAHPDGSYREHH